MCHPLYTQARGMVGRPVYVHHVSGRRYHGTLTSVAPHGVYLMQHPPGARPVSMERPDVGLPASQDIDVSLVFSPVAYFGFGALTGLTLGALAGGYGYGYGGYGGYYW